MSPIAYLPCPIKLFDSVFNYLCNEVIPTYHTTYHTRPERLLKLLILSFLYRLWSIFIIPSGIRKSWDSGFSTVNPFKFIIILVLISFIHLYKLCYRNYIMREGAREGADLVKQIWIWDGPTLFPVCFANIFTGVATFIIWL